MSAVLQSRAAERQMLDAIGEAVVASDAAARIVYCNRAAERLYGATIEELRGRRLRDLIAPSVSDAEVEEIRACVIEGRCWSGVVTGRRADGTTFPQRVTLSPMHDDGEPVGVIGVAADITEERENAARARMADERFERVFAESPVGIGLVTPDLRIQQSNRALQVLLGYSAEELADRTLESVTHPDDFEEEVATVNRMLAGDVPSQQIHKRFVRKDGTVVIGRVTGTVVFGDDGEPLYGIGTVEDLTATMSAFTEVQAQKERLAATLEAAGVATWDLDFATMRQTVSDNYADLLGLPFDEVPETFDEILAMVHPDDQALFLDPTPEPGAVGDRFDVEFRIVRPRGGTVWVGCKGSFVRDESGEAVALRGTMVNLTEQRNVEIRRVEAEERYRQTIEAANDAFVGLDATGRICEWNAAASRMFGWPADEILGQPVLDTLIPEDRRERYRLGWEHWEREMQAGNALPERWEMNALHQDGRVFPVEMSVVTGVDGSAGHIRAFVRDITERRAREQRLAERAVTDTLTGLPDRSVLLADLGRAIDRLDERPGAVAVLFIDVDRFKQVNDGLGHDAGDQLLVSLAQRLRSAVRPSDTVARIGGDEFAVVCDDLASAEDAVQVAGRVLAALEAPFPLGRRQYDAAASIGIATATEATAEPEAVVRDADLAMYRAKKAGGASYAVHGR